MGDHTVKLTKLIRHRYKIVNRSLKKEDLRLDRIETRLESAIKTQDDILTSINSSWVVGRKTTLSGDSQELFQLLHKLVPLIATIDLSGNGPDGEPNELKLERIFRDVRSWRQDHVRDGVVHEGDEPVETISHDEPPMVSAEAATSATDAIIGGTSGSVGGTFSYGGRQTAETGTPGAVES